MKAAFFHFMAGLASGIIIKLLDIHTQNLGNMFSQISVWILIGTAISLRSPSRKQAALRVTALSAGMLAAYYAAAELLHATWSPAFAIGWTIFCALCPALGALTWQCRLPGRTSRMLSAGIIAATLLSSRLFHGPRIYDIAIIAAEIWLLFIKKHS